MKTVFIVNPKAGKGKKEKQLIEQICTLIALNNTDWEWYLTQSVGDATRFVKEYCETKGVARFIACGGDGTFGEVVNGVFGFPDAEVGVIPIGTGNDFCRNFSKNIDFFDLELQASSKTAVCDVIRYVTEVDGMEKQGICANMFNIGFDCNVADKTNDFKANTIFGGSFAYVVSILWNLIRKKSTNLLVELDGIKQYNGELLLCSVANGKYCGGGIMSNPLAEVTDGKMNVNLIRNISRLRFLSLLPSYMKGTHLKIRGIEKIIINRDCEILTVTPKTGIMRLCIDGEIITAGTTTFTVIPGGIRFVLPQKNR
ncbi:MAG: YegS/Rv2252/BmrU family lipid kinase [Clostridia bacterium]|nr:YegS/Rv2252/BmrU family lipid kinase [Clostridia bacterium]